jgi:hypothetical protein
LVDERRQRIDRIFARHGVDAMRLSTNGNLVNEIARFVHLRKESLRRSGGRVGGIAR